VIDLKGIFERALMLAQTSAEVLDRHHELDAQREAIMDRYHELMIFAASVPMDVGGALFDAHDLALLQPEIFDAVAHYTLLLVALGMNTVVQ
jgi:hypothetical protein